MTNMPKINLNLLESQVSSEEFEILKKVVTTKKGETFLRAGKPKITYIPRPDGVHQDPEFVSGSAAYVWRMIAFYISPIYQHHCMPCTAEFDLPQNDYTERRAYSKKLDLLVDKVYATIPVEERHGIKRWARVLG